MQADDNSNPASPPLCPTTTTTAAPMASAPAALLEDATRTLAPTVALTRTAPETVSTSTASAAACAAAAPSTARRSVKRHPSPTRTYRAWSEPVPLLMMFPEQPETDDGRNLRPEQPCLWSTASSSPCTSELSGMFGGGAGTSGDDADADDDASPRQSPARRHVPARHGSLPGNLTRSCRSASPNTAASAAAAAAGSSPSLLQRRRGRFSLSSLDSSSSLQLDQEDRQLCASLPSLDLHADDTHSNDQLDELFDRALSAMDTDTPASRAVVSAVAANSRKGDLSCTPDTDTGVPSPPALYCPPLPHNDMFGCAEQGPLK
eukprot:m.321820 g.321820  ORF g.321820 m.321820 type:complete len:319 (-) comp25981_c0_seq1:40-996(-)